jgi:hypothetical protein
MSGHANVGRPHELRFELRFAVLEQHLDDLAQVCVKLIERRTLRMRTGPLRDGTNRPVAGSRSTTAVKFLMSSDNIAEREWTVDLVLPSLPQPSAEGEGVGLKDSYREPRAVLRERSPLGHAMPHVMVVPAWTSLRTLVLGGGVVP